jgi:hypothetical protein
MLQIVGWVGGWGGIVIPMPEALSFAESRRQKWSRYGQIFMYLSTLFALEKPDWSTTKRLQTKTRQQHSDERPNRRPLALCSGQYNPLEVGPENLWTRPR